MLLKLILLVALHGEQGIDLAFQAADGEKQFFVVGGGHGQQSVAPANSGSVFRYAYA